MRIVLGAFLLLRPVYQDVPSPAEHLRSVRVAGEVRQYRVDIPESISPEVPSPLVVAFHGGLSNPGAMIQFMGLDTTADEQGFVVVYPIGTGRLQSLLTFNAGNCCGYATNHGVDDVAFTRALLEDLDTWINIDPKRIFAKGMSNGAMMAYRIGS